MKQFIIIKKNPENINRDEGRNASFTCMMTFFSLTPSSHWGEGRGRSHNRFNLHQFKSPTYSHYWHNQIVILNDGKLLISI